MFNFISKILLLSSYVVTGLAATETAKLPPISDFMLDEAREIALAKSAAPAKISANASIMVLRSKGYETVSKGSNGFVCMVVRSWGNPDFDPKYTHDPSIMIPECLDRYAVDIILPLQLYRAELGLQRTPPEKMRDLVWAGFNNGRFKRIESLAFSYMMSADMNVRPHVMIYLPDHYTNEDAGGLGYRDGVAYVEGGPKGPYVAAMVFQLDRGIDPVFE